MSTTPTLRTMSQGDLPHVAALCRTLGYDVADTAVAGRFARISGRPDAALVVAADGDDRPQGFLHVLEKTILEGPSEALVQALVVGGESRHAGWSAALLDWAEDWARKRGLARVTLSAASASEEAHAFYRERGYEAVTQSVVFAKALY